MDKEILIKNFSKSARTYDKYSDIQNKTALQLLGLINPDFALGFEENGLNPCPRQRRGEQENRRRIRCNTPRTLLRVERSNDKELEPFYRNPNANSGLNQNGFKQILEIGCGTGNYTQLLRNKFKNAKLCAIDISADMIEVASGKFKAKEVEFKVGDAENIDLGKRFDLITSNACFQWFENLEAALKRYADFLNAPGLVMFSIFGNATFGELNESLKSLFPSVVGPVRSLSHSNGCTVASNGVSQDKLRFALENSFPEVQVEEFIYEEKFARLKDLLLKIKYTGIRGDGWGNKTLLTPGMLNRLENKYLEKFKEIKATYQVFYCRARKKG